MLAYGFALALSIVGTPSAQTAVQPKPWLTVKEAEQIVNEAFPAIHGPSPVPGNKKLVEIDDPEIRDHMSGQLFRAEGPPKDAFLIVDRKPYRLTESDLGGGLISCFVEDLDGDNSPELAYTYAWSLSGVGHCVLASVSKNGNYRPTKFGKVFGRQWMIVNAPNGGVDLYVARHEEKPPNPKGLVWTFSAERRLGKVVLRRNRGKQVLDVELEPGLPQDVLSSLRRK
jgi:hypothetical protein